MRKDFYAQTQYRPPEWGAEVNPLSRGLHDPERVSGGEISVRLRESRETNFVGRFQRYNQDRFTRTNRLPDGLRRAD
jgi:hypothetical protein